MFADEEILCNEQNILLETLLLKQIENELMLKQIENELMLKQIENESMIKKILHYQYYKYENTSKIEIKNRDKE